LDRRLRRYGLSKGLLHSGRGELSWRRLDDPRLLLLLLVLLLRQVSVRCCILRLVDVKILLVLILLVLDIGMTMKAKLVPVTNRHRLCELPSVQQVCSNTRS